MYVWNLIKGVFLFDRLQSGNTTFLTYAWTCVTPWEKTRQVQAMGGQQIEHHWIRKSAATYIFFPCTRNMELIPCHLYLLFLKTSQSVWENENLISIQIKIIIRIFFQYIIIKMCGIFQLAGPLWWPHKVRPH